MPEQIERQAKYWKAGSSKAAFRGPQWKGVPGMSETMQIVLGICVLVAVYIFTRQFHAWRFSKTYRFIINDLQEKGALNPDSAVDLPYAKKSMLRIGTRDYRPKALEHLAMKRIVGMTENGRYYLIPKPEDLPTV
ncbi:conserved hypothetical protein [delta proteobacterium NaphS2]|nr:conserved hypothetical protein [delta proteobacterium NaphS2]